ncbi:terminase small subunit protein [Sinorhizobium medicae]|uniref:terminase small subunit-like protein n=1 Tax=Sinorhizobium medicae TaxID=110321 RepID=UPI001AAE3BC6|nr:terminase small subunit protein [Sinorhizobium medicae]MBO1963828.1 terminase small subunit protein [Sinorhizobium medicae]
MASSPLRDGKTEMASPPGGNCGRPSSFTEELAAAICERISNGESLRSICEDEGFPSKSTVFKWLSENEVFSDQYARAREAQADAIFDDILSIADDARNDWMEKLDSEGGNLGWRENGEAVRRSQLRIEARKWMAGKLRPKKYGEKLDLNVSGTLETMPEERLNARIAQLLGKAGAGSAAGGTGSADASEPPEDV